MAKQLFTYSKKNAKGNKDLTTVAFGSVLNKTINDLIVLFGDHEEDVHLFEGR